MPRYYSTQLAFLRAMVLLLYRTGKGLKELLSQVFYRWENCSSERCCGIVKATQQTNSRAQNRAQGPFTFRSLYHCDPLSCSKAVVLSISQASESPGGLVNTQIAGPYSRVSVSIVLGQGQGICISIKCPGGGDDSIVH